MLRYKNSLLERILLEKGGALDTIALLLAMADKLLAGIDVQAELRAKTGSPSLGPTHVPQNLVQPPPIQRAILNRHHARRSNSSIAPKSEPGVSPLAPAGSATNPHSSAASPKSRPTPSSHSASPGATTSFGSQHGASPAGSGPEHMNPGIRPALQPVIKAAQPFPGAAAMAAGALPRPIGLPPIQPNGPAGRSAAVSVAQAGATGAPYYAAPAFQNHMEQLGKLARFLIFLPFPSCGTLFVLDSFREYRTGIRCRRRHDGGSRRSSRHAERAWSVPRRPLRRRTAAHVVILASHDRSAGCCGASHRGTLANRRLCATHDASRAISVHDAAARHKLGLGSIRLECEYGVSNTVLV
jgi:hypothetical protein